MGLNHYKPTTSSRRGLVLVDRSHLWKGGPISTLSKGISSKGGRNNKGRITARHRGGGHKRLYRQIDFRRRRFGIKARVERLEYDPNRSSFIALIKYEDGQLSYILAPQNLKVGDEVVSDDKKTSINLGCAMFLENIPIGSAVHNVELKPGRGGQLAKSGGVSAHLVGRDGIYAQLRLPSGEIRMVLGKCMASIGVLSNPDQQNIRLAKAGRKRWLGRCPAVRGVAMNPIDHPHGGGEGKTSGGRHPVSPWGNPTKGKNTRSSKRSNQYIIRSRKKRR